MTYVQPLIFICLTTVFAGLWMSQPSRGKKIALAGALALGCVSLPAFDWLASRPLENGYPVRAFEAPPGIQAIVVLASGIEPPHFERPYPLADAETFQACRYAAWIYRQYGQRPVLACEGRPEGKAETSAMCELLREGGVPENMIWLERQSRSTHENAVEGSRILRLHGVSRIALVVDAQSMPRAAACFRKEGMEVTAAPSELRSFGPLGEELFPSWKAIRRNELTLHEIGGLVWYRLHGWI